MQVIQWSMLALMMTSLASCSSSDAADADAAKPHPGFAVVELFTSEGCSSCPPADEQLSRILAEARKNGSAVYPLAFHVDYWNNLGWRDRFSSADFSARQQAYATVMGRTQIYTPQMIVNGSEEFIGSDGEKANNAIKTALEKGPADSLKIEAMLKDRKLSVRYDIIIGSKPTTGTDLNIAIVERGLETAVKAGENSHCTLKHDNVVRLFKTVSPTDDGKGTVELNLPDGVEVKNISVIAFLQDSKSMKILAASGCDVAK